jgi:hypothetical protein
MVRVLVVTLVADVVPDVVQQGGVGKEQPVFGKASEALA